MKSTVKYFFMADVFLGGLILVWINSFFCWQYVLLGGLSCIQVNTVCKKLYAQ